MTRTDGYGRTVAKDAHPFRDPFAQLGGRANVQQTRRPGSAPRMRRTPDSQQRRTPDSRADSRQRSARSARTQRAKDADEFVSREWHRSPWGGFENRIAQPTSGLDGERRGLPARIDRSAGVGGKARPFAREDAPPRQSRSARAHTVGRYGDGSGRAAPGEWLTYKAESREDLSAAAKQNPARKAEVARARIREREVALRRSGPRLDRRLERALHYLHNRSGYPENDPDPDGTHAAREISARIQDAWRHAEDAEDERAGWPPGDISRRRRWSEGELAYDAARHTQDELGPEDYLPESEDYYRYTDQRTGRGAQPAAALFSPQVSVDGAMGYSEGVEQALVRQKEEAMVSTHAIFTVM